MKVFLKKHRRALIIGLIVVILLTLLFAPGRNRDARGSTYGRGPSGYGAWYAQMEQNGARIQRWRKPLGQLLEQDAAEPVTLVQVGITPQWLQDRASEGDELEAWLAEGNRLIVLGTFLGSEAPVTAAPFETQHDTAQGEVAIATTRRYDETLISSEGSSRTDSPNEEWAEAEVSPPDILIEDSFGAIARRISEGKGDRIEAITPYIAANAYQDSPGNFAWLSEQVGEGEIWVNEFSHGYKDRESLAQEGVKGWQDYFLRSPLVLFLIQGGVILGVAILAQNRRWGPKQPVLPPPVNNSEAYITALAGVLRRAGNSNFALEQCRAAEQRRIQQQLGLGNRPVPLEELLYSWEQETGQSSEALRQLLVSDVPERRVTEKDLVEWLKRSQTLRADALAIRS